MFLILQIPSDSKAIWVFPLHKKPSQHERKDSQNNRKMFENVETNYH